MDDENRGVSGMKVLMRSNKFYMKGRERIIDYVVFSDVFFSTPTISSTTSTVSNNSILSQHYPE